MPASALNAEQLHSAFEIFNQHSDQLENSYRELEARVASLSAQLAAAHSARHAELVQKERLSHRMALLLDTLPGAIVVINGEGVIQEQNSLAVSLLNEPLSGCTWADIVRREANSKSNGDGNIQLHDGRWLSLSRRPLESEPGEILLLADITGSRQVSELRQRSERLTAIGEMTARFAHEVRTPLASAMLHVSQLKPASGAQERIIPKISERLSDLGRMVNNMLSFAAGARRASDRVNVHDLLTEVAETIRPQLRGDTVLELLIDGSCIEHCEAHDGSLADDFVIAANLDSLKGALANLVSNADQAAESAMRIQVGAWRDESTVFFTVTDDGPGIPDEVRANIFDPFFTTRPQGTGLGLAVVRAIARSHGGDVSVDSLSVGTRFTLSLPLSDPEPGNNVDE